jgi:hypothetical protein
MTILAKINVTELSPDFEREHWSIREPKYRCSCFMLIVTKFNKAVTRELQILSIVSFYSSKQRWLSLVRALWMTNFFLTQLSKLLTHVPSFIPQNKIERSYSFLLSRSVLKHVNNIVIVQIVVAKISFQADFGTSLVSLLAATREWSLV